MCKRWALASSALAEPWRPLGESNPSFQIEKRAEIEGEQRVRQTRRSNSPLTISKGYNVAAKQASRFEDGPHFRILPWLNGYRVIYHPIDGPVQFHDVETQGLANQLRLELVAQGVPGRVEA